MCQGKRVHNKCGSSILALAGGLKRGVRSCKIVHSWIERRRIQPQGRFYTLVVSIHSKVQLAKIP